MKKSTFVLLAMIPLLFGGCVSTKKYKALQGDLDSTRSELKGTIEERDGRIKSLEEVLAGANATATALQTQIDAVKAELAAEQTQKTELQGQLAQTVKDRSRLKASVEEMQQALNELEARKREADARVAEFRDLLGRFKPLIDTGKLSVKIVDGRMVVQLATDVLFSSGSAKLSPEGAESIRQVGQVLSQVTDKKFQVEGHTDNVPIKTAQYPSNWELAAARAITVVQELATAGMASERLSAASFGQLTPAASNDTKEGRAANRRIEIVLLPDLSSLPGFDELKKAATTPDQG